MQQDQIKKLAEFLAKQLCQDYWIADDFDYELRKTDAVDVSDFSLAIEEIVTKYVLSQKTKT